MAHAEDHRSRFRAQGSGNLRDSNHRGGGWDSSTILFIAGGSIPSGSSTANVVAQGLDSFRSYSQLQDFMAANAKSAQQYNRQGTWLGGPLKAFGGMTATATFAANVATPSGPATPTFTGTNVQVQGVDEPDRVKTDGTHLFVSTGNAVDDHKRLPAQLHVDPFDYSLPERQRPGDRDLPEPPDGHRPAEFQRHVRRPPALQHLEPLLAEADGEHERRGDLRGCTPRPGLLLRRNPAALLPVQQQWQRDRRDAGRHRERRDYDPSAHFGLLRPQQGPNQLLHHGSQHEHVHREGEHPFCPHRPVFDGLRFNVKHLRRLHQLPGVLRRQHSGRHLHRRRHIFYRRRSRDRTARSSAHRTRTVP